MRSIFISPSLLQIRLPRSACRRNPSSAASGEGQPPCLIHRFILKGALSQRGGGRGGYSAAESSYTVSSSSGQMEYYSYGSLQDLIYMLQNPSFSGGKERAGHLQYYPFRMTPYLMKVQDAELGEEQFCCLLLAERVHSAYEGEAPSVCSD